MSIFWVFLFVFVDVLGFSIILPLFPYYAKDFQASPGTIGLLLTSNALSQMISAPVIGRLSDRYGRKPLLVLCISGTVIGFFILATATTVFELFLSRIIDGVLGGNISLAQAYISDISEAKDRTKAMGVVGAAFGLGFIFGPAIGGSLSVYGYRIPAIIATIVSLINLLGVLIFLPESLPKEKRILHASEKKPIEPHWLPLHTSLKTPVLGSLLILRFIYGYTFTLFETCFGFFNVERLSLDARTSSYFLAFVGLVFSLVQSPRGFQRFTQRTTEGKVILVSCVILSFSLLLWASTFTISLLILALFPISLTSGLLNNLINSQISKHVKQNELGETLGISASIGSLTRVLAPISSGVLIDHFGIWAPGLFGALLMLYSAHFTYSNSLHKLLTSEENHQHHHIQKNEQKNEQQEEDDNSKITYDGDGSH